MYSLVQPKSIVLETHLGAGDIGRVIQEVAIMKTLDHPNIIKLFDAQTFKSKMGSPLDVEVIP